MSVAAAACMLSSCIDTIILPDDKTVDQDFWQTKADVASMVNSAYAAMASNDNIARFIVWGDFRSDEMVLSTSPSGGTYDALEEMAAVNMQTTNQYAEWASLYTVINRCNIVLERAEEVMNIANDAYHAWKKARDIEDNPDEEPTDNTAESDNSMKLEQLESDAREGIKAFIASKDPYEFQDMVAALLRAMEYHTPFIAPKGKDGGIDIIAYLDPLGAKTPRIKVQVKHKPETAIGASEVRALSGVLKAGDIALFVTSGTYSADARNAASGNDKFIRLIDGNDFIEMWQEYYDKMSDDDKNMLPLKRISFLGNNE